VTFYLTGTRSAGNGKTKVYNNLRSILQPRSLLDIAKISLQVRSKGQRICTPQREKDPL